MPVVDTLNGVVTPRRIGEPLSAVVAAARAEFGPGVSNPANTIRELIEALGAIPWDLREQDILNLSLEFDPRINHGQFLEAALWPLFKRRQPAAAAGIVNLNYNQIVTSPDPVFAAADLEFIDGAGVRYTGSDDVSPPATIHDTSGQTGTFSETIGSGNSKIAQKVTISDTNFPQSIRIGLADVLSGTPVIAVQIQGDSSGPDGIVADARLAITAVPVVDGGNTDVIFEKGAYLDTDDYWVVITVTGGTVRFDGGVGGTANQVMFYNGAWAASAIPVENLNLKLYNGGEFNVVAATLGETANIEVDAIGSVRSNSGAAQTEFDTVVDSFENLQAFEGGRDLETDEQLRARARSGSAARGTSSPGGLVTGMQDRSVDGVTFVDILENDTVDWGIDQHILDNSLKTGTNSESVNGGAVQRIAQRFTTTGYGSVSAIAVKLGVNNSAEMTLRVETEATGSPSGTLASTKFEKLACVPSGTSRTVFEFAKGDYLPAGTYWVTARQTNGDFRFDGSAAGATDNVKKYNGSAWALSTSVEDMNIEILGGLPGKSFELFVEGGSDNDVAQGIYDLKAPGIATYGPVTGVARDVADRAVTIHFSRITDLDVVMDIEIEVTSDFAGDEDTVRDLVTEYLAELGIGAELVRQEAMSRLLSGDSRNIGVFDITKFRLGKKTSFANPAALGSGQVVNLTLGFGERFQIANPDTDVTVTLVQV